MSETDSVIDGVDRRHLTADERLEAAENEADPRLTKRAIIALSVGFCLLMGAIIANGFVQMAKKEEVQVAETTEGQRPQSAQDYDQNELFGEQVDRQRRIVSLDDDEVVPSTLPGSRPVPVAAGSARPTVQTRRLPTDYYEQLGREMTIESKASRAGTGSSGQVAQAARPNGLTLDQSLAGGSERNVTPAAFGAALGGSIDEARRANLDRIATLRAQREEAQKRLDSVMASGGSQ